MSFWEVLVEKISCQVETLLLIGNHVSKLVSKQYLKFFSFSTGFLWSVCKQDFKLIQRRLKVCKTCKGMILWAHLVQLRFILLQN